MLTQRRGQAVWFTAALVMLASLTLLGGCGSPARARPTPTPWPTPLVSEKPVYTVQRGTVIDRFTLSGQVVPVVWDPLYFRVDGRLASLKVIEGNDVKQDDLLAELEMKTLSDQLTQAELSLEQAQDQSAQQESSRSFALERARLNLQLQQLALQKIQRTTRDAVPLQLEAAQKDLERAKIDLDRAQSAYDKVASRSDVGATPQAAALQQATVDYQAAEIRYKLQTLGDSDTQVATQDVQVKLAELAVRELEQSTDPTRERNVTKAKIEVDALRRQMEERRLRAPYSGKILAIGLNMQFPQQGSAQRPKVGDNIPAFTPLVVIAKPEQLQIIVSTDSPRAFDLTVGQAVTVTHPASRDHPFLAQVVAIPLKSLGSGTQAASPQVDRVGLPVDAPAMSAGDFVDIDVISDIHRDTLFLPPAAVRHFGGRAFAVIAQEGKQRRIDVTTGLENEKQVEILSGLTEGDTVVGP